jgi:hypothetical protein
LKYYKSRYRVSLFVATDNILAPVHVVPLPAAISTELKDIEVFFEVRAVMTRRSLQSLAQAGIVHLQVGIESLIPEVLEMVDKGTTPIDNLSERSGTSLNQRDGWAIWATLRCAGLADRISTLCRDSPVGSIRGSPPANPPG